MPLDLPPSVLAGMGIQGQPSMPPDDGSAAVPLDPYGGLHPSVVQGLGWAPPPQVGMPQASPDQLPSPPQFTSLPSASEGGQPSSPQQPTDFVVKPPGEQAPRTAAAQPQAPRALTPEQGFATAQARQEAAQKAEESAVQQQVEAKRPENEADLAASREHLATEQANDEQSKQIADAKMKAGAANQEKIKATDQEINNYKVDQDKYWKDTGVGTHIGWYIAMALSRIGMTLQHNNGPNPVVQMLQDKMHQAVVAQVDARDQLKEKRGRIAQEGADEQKGFADRQAEILRLQGQSDRMLANKMELDAKAAGNSIDQAKAAQEIARLRASGADKYQAGVVQQSDFDIKKQQLGLQKSANAIAGGHLALAQQAERRAQKLQDLEYGPGGFKEQELGIKAADEQRKAIKDQQAKIKDEGIYNPSTGDGLLTERGRSMMSAADQIEVAARTDPARAAGAYVAKLRAQATSPAARAQVDQIEQHIKADPSVAQEVAGGYAAQLRQEAKTTQVATIADPTARREVQDGVKWGQDLVNTTAKIKNFLTNDPGITDRDGWAKLQSEYGTAMVEYTRSIGARVSSRELDAISKHIMTYDPSSIIDRTFRKAPGASALEGLQDAVKGGVDSMLRSHGIKDGWIPSAPVVSPGFGGQTSQEAGAGEEPGAIRKFVTGPIANDLGILGGTPTAKFQYDPEDDKQAAENAALARTVKVRTPGGETIDKPGEAGLSPEDTLTVEGMVRRAGAAPNAERARIADSLASPIMNGDRPSLAAGMLRLVQAQDPALYEEVLGRLPKMRADEIRRFDAGREKLPGADLPPMAGR
jgi:hypothetical protein